MTLLVGETNRNLDAGLVSVVTTTTTTTTTPAATVCVGDYVWADTNGNGVQDAGEAGIGGVRATIYRADGTEVLYTLSNSAGAWQICGIAPGSYFVRFTGLPVNTTFTTPRVGGNPATDSDPDASGTTPVFAVGTVNVLTIDAGIIVTTTPLVIVLPNVPLLTTTIPPTTTTRPSGCLGDKIFRDPGNAKDGTGISGVTIVLGRSDHSTLTTVTDGNGNYSFCLLPPGTYTVTVHPPAGSTNTYDIDGNKDNKVSALLRTGESNLDLDFGYSTINVGPEVITQTTLAPAAPSTPIESPPLSYTGARSTLLALWALTFLLVGYGLFGLTPARRRRSPVG